MFYFLGYKDITLNFLNLFSTNLKQNRIWCWLICANPLLNPCKDLKSFIQRIMFPIAQCCTNLNVKVTTSGWLLLSPFSRNSFHMFIFKLPFLLNSFKCLALHNWLGFFFFGPILWTLLCYESMGSFIIGFHFREIIFL
jgi:hypothetical protein